ncbi:UDP-N-acetylglucosamine--N-acetylmuramyl-(pentapeptide) pyrophosphoryl-undecaprenol N-acetylglucosamine transferase [Quadrisphaera sp. KR29]|uniref:UDP-N-acetylglucosamine--N-acetylmuramyl- (pentapeptide) pyrophosphoryl-undecaprenol N-acetylglucosamine transferase n=1 Tax=Quadrisphaera sp. KR29 TaxID=3461391 RepID=UPI004043B010
MTPPAGPDRPLAVLLAGGGTTGHVSPLLALADCLRRRDPATGVLVLGTDEGLEARLVPARGYELAVVPRVPLPRRPSAALLRLPGRLARAVRAAERAVVQAGRAVGAERADVVVGVGGYVAVPAYLAARRLGVPVVVHEANFRPGVANRLGARLTEHVATTFPGTALRGRGGASALTGLPMRTEVTGLDRAARRAEARAAFDLDPGAPVLLVTGGSLGAQRLNAAVVEGAPELLAAPAGGGPAPQVLHLTGAGKAVQPSGLPAGATYRVLEYTDRMDLAYAAADLVLCRAGAGTVCETTAVGLPAVYVPLPVGNGEQRLNAAGAVAAGSALLVDDAEVTADWVRGPLRDLLTDADGAHRLAAMTAAAGSSSLAAGARDGDERLADLVERAAGRTGAGRRR